MRAPYPPVRIPSENIINFRYHKLRGRIAHFKSTSNAKRTIVLIPGHHSAHERMLSFAHFLQRFGNIYMVDLPGFGGMDDFYKIHQKPSHDRYAEYLYTVLKTQKLNKDVTIFVVSLGSQYVSRMFQMYPESQTWVTRVVSFVGFASPNDYRMNPVYFAGLKAYVAVASTRFGNFLMRLLVLNRLSLKLMLDIFSRVKSKMKTDDEELRKQFIQMEYSLWLNNHPRTQAVTAHQMFRYDLRKQDADLINVPMVNILSREDQYFDTREVNKSFRDVYADYRPYYLEIGSHMPSMVADDKAVADFFAGVDFNEILGSKDG